MENQEITRILAEIRGFFADSNGFDFSMQVQALDEAIAAIRDLRKKEAYRRKYIEALKKYAPDLCVLCKNVVKCVGEDCPDYRCAKGYVQDGQNSDLPRHCIDYDFGICEMQKACKDCSDNNFSNFEPID